MYVDNRQTTIVSMLPGYKHKGYSVVFVGELTQTNCRQQRFLFLEPFLAMHVAV